MDKKGDTTLVGIKAKFKAEQQEADQKAKALIKVGDQVIRYYSAGNAGSSRTSTYITKVLKTGFRIASHPEELYDFHGRIKRSQSKRRASYNWGTILKVLFHGR